MRLVTGTISHETNVFSNIPAELNKFNRLYGEDALMHFKGTKTPVGGLIDGCANHNFDLVPTIHAAHGPSGRVTADAFDILFKEMMDRINAARPFDGVVLHLHGAGMSENYDDIEGRILSEVRKIIGNNMPLVSTFDFHANYTKLMVDNADILVGYDTNPHIDGYERGIEAIDLMARLLEKKLVPTKAFRKLPMILAGNASRTEIYPMKLIMETAQKMEKIENVETITVAGGFAYSDFEDIGPGIIVTTNNDQQLADRCADELKDLTWSLRKEFLVKGLSTVKEGIQKVKVAKEGPIILADTADAPGGGGPGDGTIVLKAILESDLENGVFAVIADKESVSMAINAGVGNEVTVDLGGKTDKLHGAPLRITGFVKLISNGKFICKGPMSTGSEENMGRTVVLVVNGIDVIVTEKRHQPVDLQVYRSLGIEPTDKKFIALKGVTHFHADHVPIAKEIIYLDTPGVCSLRLAGFNYKKIRRPIFPLDVKLLGITELKNMEEE